MIYEVIFEDPIFGAILISDESKTKKKKRKSYPITGLDKPIEARKVETPRISRQLLHEGGKVVSPTHRPSLSPEEHPWFSFLLGDESTPGL